MTLSYAASPGPLPRGRLNQGLQSQLRGYESEIPRHCQAAAGREWPVALALTFCSLADRVALSRLEQAINKEAGTTSFVIDAEAVAWDTDEKRLLPFQELSKRKRKDVKAEDIKVKVHLFAFDLLYLNGKVSCCSALSRQGSRRDSLSFGDCC